MFPVPRITKPLCAFAYVAPRAETQLSSVYKATIVRRQWHPPRSHYL